MDDHIEFIDRFKDVYFDDVFKAPIRKYKPVVDLSKPPMIKYGSNMTLFDLAYSTAVGYNLPLCKIPKSLRRPDIQMVSIHHKHICYYTDIIRSDASYITRMLTPNSFELRGYNTVPFVHIPNGYIPSTVVCVKTTRPISLTSSIKYLMCENMGTDFHIDVELDYLHIKKCRNIITTSKPIKILVMHDYYFIDQINNLLKYTKHIIVNNPHYFKLHIDDLYDGMQTILTWNYNTFSTRLPITSFVELNKKYTTNWSVWF
jgi:hypothetical protein